MGTDKKSTTIQVKMSQSIKDEIERRATTANVTTSEYIRTVAVSDGKFIVLDKGGDIAKALIDISIMLEKALIAKEISAEIEQNLLATLDDVYAKFDDIMDKLTDIHNDESEEE